MKRMLIVAIAVAGCVATGAIDAGAQGVGTFKGFLTGHVGAISGGDVGSARATLGASVAVHENTGWGAEIDFGHAADAVSGRQILDVTSYMVNAIWVRPDGLIRPFGVGGAGVLQVSGCDSPCNRTARTYDFGLSAGAGAFYVINDVAGLRADVRYVRSTADHPDLRRPDNLNYWRLSFGATFIWAIAP
jgi:hypothetical protein